MTALVPISDIQQMADRIMAASTPEPNTGCWLWLGSTGNSGYGKLRIGHTQDVSAHRASFATFKGLIPSGMCVLHSCDVRLCVNPDHLFIGTKSDNTRDMVRKGRHKCPARLRTSCPKGHFYDGVNTYGRRICSICNKQTRQRYEERRRANV